MVTQFVFEAGLGNLQTFLRKAVTGTIHLFIRHCCNINRNAKKRPRYVIIPSILLEKSPMALCVCVIVSWCHVFVCQNACGQRCLCANKVQHYFCFKFLCVESCVKVSVC